MRNLSIRLRFWGNKCLKRNWRRTKRRHGPEFENRVHGVFHLQTIVQCRRLILLCKFCWFVKIISIKNDCVSEKSKNASIMNWVRRILKKRLSNTQWVFIFSNRKSITMSITLSRWWQVDNFFDRIQVFLLWRSVVVVMMMMTDDTVEPRAQSVSEKQLRPGLWGSNKFEFEG